MQGCWLLRGVRGLAESARNIYRDHKQLVLYRELQRNPELFEEMKERYRELLRLLDIYE